MYSQIQRSIDKDEASRETAFSLSSARLVSSDALILLVFSFRCFVMNNLLGSENASLR